MKSVTKALTNGKWHCILAIMDITIDKFGRILIPKEIRDELGLQEGTSLSVKRSDNHVTLTPRSPGSPLMRKGRVLVFKGVPEGDVSNAVKENGHVKELSDKEVRNRSVSYISM